MTNGGWCKDYRGELNSDARITVNSLNLSQARRQDDLRGEHTRFGVPCFLEDGILSDNA